MSWSQVPTLKREKKSGQIVVNDEKDYIRPFELPIDAPNQIITAAANTRVGPFALSARHDGPIEVFYIKAHVTDENGDDLTDYNIDFQLSHPGKRKIFSNRLIPLIACAGDAGRPYILPESIFLPPIQALLVEFNNLDGAERTIEFVLGGIKYYPNSAPKHLRKELWNYTQRRERTYTYMMTTDEEMALTGSETENSSFLTIPDDADLEILKMTCEATGDFRTRIKDSENDRAVTGNKLRASLLFGGHIATAMGGGIGGSGGIFPARWATSLLVRRSTQLELITDELSGNANTVKPVFAGRKISYAS